MREKKQQSFFEKHKKWIIALVGIQLVPLILLGGGAIYLFANNDINFHPYKSYIIKGYKIGYSDGSRDEVHGQIPAYSLWDTYWRETEAIKKQVALEKKEYLEQFPKSERGDKLAEMRIKNIKLPLQLELEKRFTRGIDFYAHYVKQRVNKESFSSNAEYQEALQDEAWKAGYAYGYRTATAGHTSRHGLHSLTK
jgi:hypothetical protein